MMLWASTLLKNRDTSSAVPTKTCDRYLETCMIFLMELSPSPKKKVSVGTTFRRWLVTKLMDIAEFLDSGSNAQKPSLKRTATRGDQSLKHLSRKDLTNLLLSEMRSLQRFYNVPIMTSLPSPSNYGPPPPITDVTLEQEFKLRQIEDALNKDDTRKEDIITVFMALQKQNFVLSNSLSNLLKNWPKPTTLDQATIDEVLSKFGISSETKD